MRDYDKIPLKNLIRAKEFRRTMTKAEQLLWYELRGGRLGARFRRQHAVGNYVLDFVSLERHLVVEVDGFTHSTDKEVSYDRARTKSLESLGFKVIRFTNAEILLAMSSVIDDIIKHIEND